MRTPTWIRLFACSPAIALLVSCGGGGGGTSQPSPTVTISISPKSIAATVQDQIQFSSSVASSTSDTSIRWTASGGVISGTGLYVAPSTPGDYVITAVSNANSSAVATASVHVVAAPAISAFNAQSGFLWLGASTTLHLAYQNGTAVLDPGGQTVASGSDVAIQPTQTTTYTLTVTNEVGRAARQTISVQVLAPGLFTLDWGGPPVLSYDATTLPDGKVFILSATPQVFDPASGTLTPTPVPSWAPAFSSHAVLLSDGRLVIAAAGHAPMLYSEASNTYLPSFPNSLPGQFLSAAVLLPMGKILCCTDVGVYLLDTGAGTVQAASTPAFPIYSATKVPLLDGRVLFAVTYPNTRYETYDPADGNFHELAITGPSVNNIAAGIALKSGKVLIVGQDDNGNDYKSATLLNLSTGTAQRTGNTQISRDMGSALVQLQDGRVLLIGGVGGTTSTGPDRTPIRQAEIYNPATGCFTATAQTDTGMDAPIAAPLPDGRVLVLGSGSLEIFTPQGDSRPKPVTGHFASAPGLTVSRTHFSILRLSDGKALAVGGTIGSNSSKVVECYDPAANAWVRLGDLATARSEPDLCLLSDGKVLVFGGGGGWNTPDALSEVYDPSAGTTQPLAYAEMSTQGQPALLTSNGKVLIFHGPLGTLLYDPQAQTFALGPQTIYDHSGGGTATLLGNGKILVAGGSQPLISQSEIYDPASNGFSPTPPFGAPIAGDPRVNALVSLPNGNALAVGSSNMVFKTQDSMFVSSGSSNGAGLAGNVAPVGDGRMLFLVPMGSAPTTVFDPSGNGGLGVFTAGPTIPAGLGVGSVPVRLGDGSTLFVDPIASSTTFLRYIP